MARKKIGALPRRRKQVTDEMVKVVAKAMTEEDKIRRSMREKLGDMRGKGLRMMEFAKAEIRSGEASELRWNDIMEDLWTEAEELFKK